MTLANLLEPPGLVEHFLAHPPQGFSAAVGASGTPRFDAPFDVLTTLEPALKRRLEALPGHAWWRRALRWRACFVGTTVSEYALLPSGPAPALADALLREGLRDRTLLIVKDLPAASPLLDAASNRHAASLAEALQQRGFVLMEGQALAWVPIDFDSSEAYVARLSAGKRRDLRRKLRRRASLEIETLATGPAFADAALRAEFYRLYRQVYDQSELHFDLLTPAFFDAVLQDAALAGRVFVYRAGGRMIGWNLCFEAGEQLVDKYVGFDYPAAREHNLYAISWIVNLEHALARGLKRYVAGWTDPQVKAHLGARFTLTRHAVYPRAAWMRALLRRLAGAFESDRAALAGHPDVAGRP